MRPGDGSHKYRHPHLRGPGDVVEHREEDGDDCTDEDTIEAGHPGPDIGQRMEAEGEVGHCGGHPAEDAAQADLRLVQG